MFIGHLPSTYLATRATAPNIHRTTFIAVMIGSVLPDIDLLWFYLVDNRAFHHHDYITHRPFFWVVLLVVGLIWQNRAPRLGSVIAGLVAGALSHILLDSIAGKIAWGWPFTDFSQPLVVVAATQSHWILSFLTHWTFAIEVALVIFALFIGLRFPRDKLD